MTQAATAKCEIKRSNSSALMLIVSNAIAAGNAALRSEDKQQCDFDYLLARWIVISMLAILKLIE